MDLTALRPWLVLLHILSVLGFLMAHGASAFVLFRVRTEHDRERIKTLLDLSQGTQGLVGILLLVFFFSGVFAGLAGPNWWNNGTLWLWTSLGLLIVIVIAMTAFGVTYLNDLRAAVGLPSSRRRGPVADLPAAVDDVALAAIQASSRPLIVSVIGIGGLALITWLMVSKPF